MTVQRVLGLTIRRQLRGWQRQVSVPIHRFDLSKGFSLVELMIVAGLTALVLAGLGALTIVSDLQVSRRNNSLQEAQEQWGRAVTFMQSEVADAATLSTTLNNAYPCTGGVPNPMLVLNGQNSAWTVVYGVRSIAAGEQGLYRGPKLLVRCGPIPLAADRNPPDHALTAKYGNLDDTNLAPQETVLLDRLPNDYPLQVLLLADASNGPPFLDAQLTITMNAGTENDGTVITFAGDQPFRVHVNRTP